MDAIDVAVVAVIPGVVEVAKRAGLPVRWAGMVAVLAGVALVALGDLAQGGSEAATPARWVVTGIVCGLAACGLYSQATRVGGRPG